ncbi:plasmid pRiA4b ORF-3 family protein [Lactiplantibacillus pentosus]|nr:plasmid pRiA4b ORF-3 family protein [Lactiplantibacillus pentosus]MCT3275706.1 plasmid pRiA4b ORF-3 family protein [Lactiplantibacillus pentosus]MCT3282484.1 plasmid pRiA4b ORF-3 family protein [Lactiplantibacillus pentosus]PRO92243.1 plasmid pRiA4b ORF-3 family protein [Lactiplantibacillus pentosus]
MNWKVNTMQSKPAEPIVAMELKIRLIQVKPSVSRTILVPTTLRYRQLHELIQIAFGWENAHLHEFQSQQISDNRSLMDVLRNIQPEGAIDEENDMVYPEILNGSLTYTYDFGEDWKHKIELGKVYTSAELTRHDLPLCIRGRGNNMLEDGFEEPGAPYSRDNINRQFYYWRMRNAK